MEVDEPAVAGPTTPKTSILPLTPPKVSIPETAVQALGAFLEAVLVEAVLEVPPTLDPRLVLGTIWNSVHEVLSQDETMKTRVADKAQFLNNVNEIGKESFIDLLRDTKRKKSWRDLLENSTYSFRLISSTLIVPCFQRSF